MILLRKFEYKQPRIHSGQLRTPVTFYEYAPKPGPEPGEQEERVLFECMAKVDKVWLKDLERAKTNGTVSDVTITIRDPHADYIPNDKHYVSIDHPYYKDMKYNVKDVLPDLQQKDFINIVGRFEK
ncbi:phage head completion protein [Oceanobacillus kimchii]|uniref:phage head completion protein n=1 Tax=Oceanobacillus kimchii TaxID=746691 RepID=UPI00295EF575|nr:head-tail adaptor protein [Oceanobacillus kimchii]